MTKERYETLKVAQIREFAKSRGIKGASSMKKAELIEAMVLKDEQERAMELARNTGMPPLKFEEESAKPAEEKREKPAEKKPAEKKAEKPAGEKREKPAEKKSEKPAKEERAKPAGEKREKPAEKKRRKPTKEEQGGVVFGYADVVAAQGCHVSTHRQSQKIVGRLTVLCATLEHKKQG